MSLKGLLKRSALAMLDAAAPFEIIATHTLATRYVRPGACVVDLGGNRGAFSRAMTDRFGARCFLVEANPALASALAADARFTVLNVAATGTCRPVTLHVASDPECSAMAPAASAEIVQSVTVDGLDWTTLLARFGVERVDVLKMDIEGAEVDVVDNMTDDQLRSIPQVTIEFHDEFGQYPRAVTERIVRRLHGLGFASMSPQRGRTYDVAFLNRRLCPGAGWVAWRARTIGQPLLWALVGVDRALRRKGIC